MPIASKPSRSRHQASCSSIVRSQGGVFKESRSPLMRTGTSRISATSLVSLRVVDSLHHSRSPCRGWIRTSVPGWSSGVSLSPMVKVPSARPIHKIVGASGVFAERERTSTVSATRNQESRPMPNWPRNLRPATAKSSRLDKPPDGGQERAHFGIRQADPVVAHDHRGVVLGRHHLDHRNQRGVQATACLDRIPGILQQLAQLDALAAVQMMAKDVDDAA